ncbi:MAG: gamma-glutamylcyclotransferase [Clostridia bacterium]|nr:gamma-glutamylcyclotransferase [Clostridia bacterium]
MAKRKLYAAYGSNLNLGQMAIRCPDAKVVGKGMIQDWALVFNGVASIEPCKGKQVPVGVWTVTAEDERMLDRYEGYPKLYRKENITVKMDGGGELTCMVYIMNGGMPAMPYPWYYDTIMHGYEFVGLNKVYLETAIQETKDRIKNLK